MDHSVNNKLIGLSFLAHFILRTSAIFSVEGGGTFLQQNKVQGAA